MNENESLCEDYNIQSINELCIKMRGEYLLTKNNNYEEKPFNIILASSDLYLRENYHSDIISSIISQKPEYVYLFIDYLNLFEKNKINKNNYINPKVTREENKIDILIKDDKTMHCIIIENKINNAGDTYRQLLKYYCSLTEKFYTVDVIVYLSIDGKKRPDRATWLPEDHQLGFDNKLIYCAVSNNSSIDLINGFLSKCLLATQTVQENSFFQQYISLLFYLGRNQMDYQLMEDFYTEMKKSDIYSTAVNIKSMIAELCKFRTMRSYKNFEDEQRHKPFKEIKLWTTNWTLRGIPEIPNEDIYVSIDSQYEENTKINFTIGHPNAKYDLIRIILETLGLFEEFICSGNNDYCKEFSFPNEEDIFYRFLENFLHLFEINKEEIKKKIDTAFPVAL